MAPLWSARSVNESTLWLENIFTFTLIIGKFIFFIFMFRLMINISGSTTWYFFNFVLLSSIEMVWERKRGSIGLIKICINGERKPIRDTVWEWLIEMLVSMHYMRRYDRVMRKMRWKKCRKEKEIGWLNKCKKMEMECEEGGRDR